MRATLLFGLGAARAGTTWLYRYLSEHPDCAMPDPKELHYFDTLDLGGRPYRVGQTKNDIGRLEKLIETAAPDRAARLTRRRDRLVGYTELMRKTEEDTLGYLGFMNKLAGQAQLVGDLTPAYGLLSEKRLRQMSGLTPKTRFVYLLRDPVDRLWSHCRMMARRQSTEEAGHQAQSEQILDRVLAGQEIEIARRSDYVGPLTRMRAALAPANWHLAFYEELFSDAAIEALCRFLGIGSKKANFGKRVLAGPEAQMAPGQYHKARAFLADQYAFVERSFDRLPDRWGTAQVEY